MDADSSPKALATLFLKLGVTAFGGPAAHIALFRREVVAKRNWLTDQHFLDLLGATNLIPGPNSTEMAIHIGYEKAGWKGLIVAGLCFILPAVLITGVFAWLYKSYGQLPEVAPFIYGIQPAIIAVMLGAIFPMAKNAFKSTELVLLGLLVLLLSLLRLHEVYLLFGAGLYGIISLSVRTKINRLNSLTPHPLLLLIAGHGLFSGLNAKLFWIFLKIGAVLYGSGYVLFAFLDTELVATGLLSRRELMDAIAVGQCTPGPIFSSVTFVGYQINGLSGAVAATVGIFLPAFVFVALLNPLVKKMRGSALFSAFLDAVNVASVALIVSVCIVMGKETVADWRTVLIFLAGLFLVFGLKKVNSALIVLTGSVLGYVFSLV